MRKHIIITALIYLFIGISIGILFIYGHIHFFSEYSGLVTDKSVLDNNLSFLERWKNVFDIYMGYFGRFGINPLVSLFTIVSACFFGYGLLKSKEWARKLGFLLIAVNIFSCLYSIYYTASVSGGQIIQTGLSAYMWWTLTSEEVKKMMRPIPREKH